MASIKLYIGSAQSIGNEHEFLIYTDDSGNQWIFAGYPADGDGIPGTNIGWGQLIATTNVYSLEASDGGEFDTLG